MTSQSLVDFRSSLALASELIVVESRLKDPPTKHSRPRVQGLRAGALVLMVGAWETFLREMVTEHFAVLTQSSGIGRRDLPIKLQTTALWNSLELALDGPPFAKTDRKDRVAAVLRAAQLAIADDIDPAALPRTRANPTSDTVARLFKDLGIAAIWTTIAPAFNAKWGTGVADLPARVDQAIRQRHIAAHTPQILSVARLDVSQNLRLLNVVAEVLDDYVAAHCQAQRAAASASGYARTAAAGAIPQPP